jgi:hypothetical protein
MSEEKKSLPPIRFCFNCGEPIGRSRDHDPLDTCGLAECEREARAARETERYEAHRQLDEDRGWNW